MLTPRPLMSTKVDILCSIGKCIASDNKLLKIAVLYRGSETQPQVTENLN